MPEPGAGRGPGGGGPSPTDPPPGDPPHLEDAALPPPLSPTEGRILLRIARNSIGEGVRRGRPLDPELGRLPARLVGDGAAFVTLELDGDLRGCIGSLEAYRPLAVDVARNAFAAAFRDPRFPPVSGDEVDLLDVHISVLGPPVPVPARSETELLRALTPGEDGVILELPPRFRSTFLPQVWDKVPDGTEFLGHLKAKAGLPRDFWSPELQFFRYRMRDVH